MRNYHRKTLVRKEYWPLIDDWYWCPLSLAQERVVRENERVGYISTNTSSWFSYKRWAKTQYKLASRLAHQCDDGRIRAPTWVEYYKHKGGGAISIRGQCRRCEKSLSDGIKGIIIMEKEL